MEVADAVTGQKTYWHLAGAKRKPTEYEIVTSRLLYHPERGLEVSLPTGAWNERYQRGSRFQCGDWDRFYDPRETTYTKYTELSSAKETFVEHLLRAVDDASDRALTPEWVTVLSRAMAPMRYPVHGLQMVAAYVGHMAPGGRVAVACLFQAADEMRRIQVIARRTSQLMRVQPDFGGASKSLWEAEPSWQPLRELVERLLVTYDWGESFAALNLVVKPTFDELFMNHFARLARLAGDDLLVRLLFSLYEDCAWHRDWSRALVMTAIADREPNRAVIQSWVDKWRPLAERAITGSEGLFGGEPAAFAEAKRQIDAACQEHVRSVGLAA